MGPTGLAAALRAWEPPRTFWMNPGPHSQDALSKQGSPCSLSLVCVCVGVGLGSLPGLDGACLVHPNSSKPQLAPYRVL